MVFTGVQTEPKQSTNSDYNNKFISNCSYVQDSTCMYNESEKHQIGEIDLVSLQFTWDS